MSGNFWECCWDRNGAYASGTQTDPRGASSGKSPFRVLRGGGWDNLAGYCRVKARGNNFPGPKRYSNRGFRAARSSVPKQ